MNPTEVVLGVLRAAGVQPAAVTPALAVALREEQAPVWQKVAVCRSLEALLERGLRVESVREVVSAASKLLGESPGIAGLHMSVLAPPQQRAPRALQLAAGSALATFARQHFNPAMTELQRQLKPFGQPGEFVLLTLGKMAASNVYGCVPFLGITLTTLQTVTRRIEDSRRRCALCTALEQMCGVIQIYLQSWERSSYPRISAQQFSSYLFPLYTCLARTWLPGCDAQVKVAILKVLSPVLAILLPRTELQGPVFEDISLLLAQYEGGDIEAFHVTKILGQILEASLANSNPIPRGHVEPLACALTHQICARGQRRPPSGHGKESHAEEISRIFLRLARLHPTELLGFFQEKLEAHQEDSRLALLLLLSKIIGDQLPELWSKRHLCVEAVKAVLGDDGIQVRLAALEAVGQLFSAGYLESVEGWPLDYISLQLAVPAPQLGHATPSLRLGGLEERAVQRASLELLYAAVASGRGASQALWATLLTFLMQLQCTGCATPLCHSLRILAEQRLRWAAPERDAGRAVNLPTPQELLARLLTLAVSPFEGPGRGAAALRLLAALWPEIFRDVAEHWWVEVPVLVQYLEGHSQYTLDQAAWQRRLQEFLKKSLGGSQQSRWSLELGKELVRQMRLYQDSSAEKAFLYKALGTALSAAGDAAGVTLQLRELLLRADYTDEAQQEGIRGCLTHSAEGQLPAVLEALRCFEEEICEAEELTCLQLGQRLPHPERARVRSALLLLYSSVALCAPRGQLFSQLAETIVPRMLHHLASGGPSQVLGHPSGPQKDPQLVLSFAQSVAEISLSIQSWVGATDFHLPQKRVLIDRLADIVRAEPPDALLSPVRQQAMESLRHLSKVPEVLSREEHWELAELCVSRVFALPPPELMEDAGQALCVGAVASLAGLVETLLLLREEGEGAGSQWLKDTFQLLGYWLASERVWERARAMHLAVHLLQAYGQRSTPPPWIPQGQFGCLAGALGPFTGDALGTIRQGACDCIRVLLSVQGNATPQEPRDQDWEWRLQRVQEGLPRESARAVRTASIQLAKVVSRALPSQEMVAFLRALLEQLRAVSAACDQTVLLWLEVTVRQRSLDLKDQVRSVVAVVCYFLRPSEDPAHRRLLARAVCILAEQHCRAVCASLLEQPLLRDSVRKELWTALGNYKDCCARILKHLLSWVGGDGGDRTSSRLLVLAALREVLLGLRNPARRLPLLADLCYALLCLLSGDPGAETASLREEDPAVGLETPRRLAVEVLQIVFCKVLPEAARGLDEGGAWILLEQPGSFLRGAALLARALAQPGHPFLDRLLHHLLPPLSPPTATCRDLSLAFCVELTGHPLLRKPEMLDRILHQLLAKSQDGHSAAVRLAALRGLGRMAEGAPREVKKHRDALLATLVHAAAGDATGPEVACESLRALGKVWGCLRRSHGGCGLQAVASQARAHFRQADDALRAAAFELFAQLARAPHAQRSKSFARAVADAFAPLLLHLWDPSPAVAKACSAAFATCAPLVGLQELPDEDKLLADILGVGASSLMRKVCRELAHKNPRLLDAVMAEVPHYTRCPWEAVRLAACKLAGILAEAVETPQLARLDLEPLLQALHSLRGDPCAAIEIAASEAVGVVRQKRQEGSWARGGRGRPLLPGWCFS